MFHDNIQTTVGNQLRIYLLSTDHSIVVTKKCLSRSLSLDFLTNKSANFICYLGIFSWKGGLPQALFLVIPLCIPKELQITIAGSKKLKWGWVFLDTLKKNPMMLYCINELLKKEVSECTSKQHASKDFVILYFPVIKLQCFWGNILISDMYLYSTSLNK